MKVLIVESPNKAKTIAGYLPKDQWIIRATTGHFMDLPSKRHGLTEDTNGQWVGEWGVIPGKENIVHDLNTISSKNHEIYIGTDDDIEGEKIAGDIVEFILQPNGIKSYKRVVFHEITQKVIIFELDNARHIDKNAINSQIARRFVDREVGYKMSNLIRWSLHKDGVDIPLNIGIGRVVSPGLHLLVEREKEIMSFVQEDKFRVLVEYSHKGIPFRMTVPTDYYEHTKKEMNDLIAYLSDPHLKHIVAGYKPEITPSSPYPPLITSRLQRGVWYLFGIQPDRTMQVAQDLFHAGLISYHRTDSYNISDEAVMGIISYLSSLYSDDLIVHQKRVYKNKAGSHDAHEAIRPTLFTEESSADLIETHPAFISSKLAKEHADVYSYIWYITISTQMADALYDTSSAIMQVGQVKLLGRSNIYALGWSDEKHAAIPQMGWEQLYGQYIKPAETDDDDIPSTETVLPRLKIGEEIQMLDVKVVHTTTRKPPRYGVGRFITTLENKKIGRPSTFATIYKKLVETKAVSLKGGNMLMPTTLGITIDDWITENAPWLNSIEHTAEFHEKLELIERGEIKTPDPIVKEYSELVADVARKINWVDPNTLSPSQDQINLAEKIIAAKGIKNVDRESLFSSRAKIKLFLDANPMPKSETVGKCPNCKTGDILERTYTKKDTGECLDYYACLSKDCGFIVWEKSIDDFFLRFKKDFSKDELKDAIKKIFSKRGGYQFIDFITKEDKKFDPIVYFEESLYNGKTSWKPSIKRGKGKE